VLKMTRPSKKRRDNPEVASEKKKAAMARRGKRGYSHKVIAGKLDRIANRTIRKIGAGDLMLGAPEALRLKATRKMNRKMVEIAAKNALNAIGFVGPEYQSVRAEIHRNMQMAANHQGTQRARQFTDKAQKLLGKKAGKFLKIYLREMQKALDLME